MPKQVHTNKLINESSPYLKSYAHQAIDWYPWGNEALEKAKRENKLLFISVGYSACYWCNKMARTCFEDPVISETLNKYYVSIKIDKEQRPDLDQFYFNAIQLMTGAGGWPISCFALPDGSPVFGGTYFQANQLLDIMLGLHEAYIEGPEQVVEIGKEMIVGLSNIDIIKEKEALYDFSIKDIKILIESWRRKFDTKNGGTQNTPKFPLPNSLLFLIYSAYYLNDNSLFNHAQLTITRMAKGGIYDQLGGGLFRYAKDAEWRVPHFEKLLGDTAQLINISSLLYKAKQNPLYKEIVESSASFLMDHLATPNGMFYSSTHAESENKEGGYYLWTYDEITQLLKEDSDFACGYFGITKDGNFNGENILYEANNLKDLASRYGLLLPEAEAKLNSIKHKLNEALQKRTYPKIDKKVITAWNCITARSFCEAYYAFSNPDYLKWAIKMSDYMIAHLITKKFKVFRTKNDEGCVSGFLDDYAYMIHFFYRLYQITGHPIYFEYIKGLMEYTIDNFYDEQSGMFFYTEKETDSPMRLMDFIDKALPSSNSIMAINLTILTYITGDTKYQNIAKQMLSNISTQIQGSGPYVAHWARSILMHTFDPIVVFAPFNEAKQMLLEIERTFHPNIFSFPETPVLTDNKNKQINGCYYYPIETNAESTTTELNKLFCFAKAAKSKKVTSDDL